MVRAGSLFDPTLLMAATVGLVLALGLSSCASRENRILTDACVKAGENGPASGPSLNARCGCAASAAEKYLDPEDLKLLVGVAGIYNENTPDDVKMKELVAGMIRSGITPGKAALAAVDMMFLAHKVANECTASGAQNV
jgi:hypothetical protein